MIWTGAAWLDWVRIKGCEGRAEWDLESRRDFRNRRSRMRAPPALAAVLSRRVARRCLTRSSENCRLAVLPTDVGHALKP
jgi:hypothetical protein